MGLEREVARIEEMNYGIGNIAPERLSTPRQVFLRSDSRGPAVHGIELGDRQDRREVISRSGSHLATPFSVRQLRVATRKQPKLPRSRPTDLAGERTSRLGGFDSPTAALSLPIFPHNTEFPKAGATNSGVKHRLHLCIVSAARSRLAGPTRVSFRPSPSSPFLAHLCAAPTAYLCP